MAHACAGARPDARRTCRRPIVQPYNMAPAPRRNGRGDRLQPVRPQPCAARPRPRPPPILRALRGQGRQGDRPSAARGLRGVRQEVFGEAHLGQVLLRSVPRRGRSPTKPRVRSAVHVRPRKVRHRPGALQGVGRRQVRCRERRREPAARGTRCGEPAPNLAGEVGGMQAVRPQICAVRRRHQPRLLQAMHGKGRQGGYQGAARGLQGVRRKVLHVQPLRPILLRSVPRRGPAARQARERPQAQVRSRQARQGGGACGGAGRRPGRRRGGSPRAAARIARGGQCRIGRPPPPLASKIFRTPDDPVVLGASIPPPHHSRSAEALSKCHVQLQYRRG